MGFTYQILLGSWNINHGVQTVSKARPLVHNSFSKKAVLTILSPFEIHFLVILLDEMLYLVDFPVVEFAAVLENRISVALHEEFA